MKVGFVTNDFSRSHVDEEGMHALGGAAEYRCRIPADGLNRLGVEAHVGFAITRRDGAFGVTPRNALSLSEEETIERSIWDCDVIVVQRHMNAEMAPSIFAARLYGQTIINDVDDLFFALPPSNRAFYASHPRTSPESNVDHYRSVLAASDAITVSTPYLAERIRAVVGRRVDVIVLRNRLDVALFSGGHEQVTDRPTLGWSGATTHRSGDLDVLTGVVPELLGSTFEERMVHVGHQEGAPRVADELGRRRADGTTDPIKVRTFPLCPLDVYARYLDEIDVGVVPLSSHPFNSAKSAVKGMEYAAAGIPFVASDTAEYRWLEAQGFGLVAAKNRPHAWRKMLLAAADDRGPQPAVDDLSIDAHAHEWREAYEAVGAPVSSSA